VDISNVSAAALGAYDVAILGEMPLTPDQVTMFGDWVNAGGNLIAMRPDKKLAGLLGLADAGGTLANGYVLVDTSAQPGAGIVGETIQFHGAADLYTLAGATRVAALYADASTAAANAPAVTLRSVGARQPRLPTTWPAPLSIPARGTRPGQGRIAMACRPSARTICITATPPAIPSRIG
jgi:hypothetical protein